MSAGLRVPTEVASLEPFVRAGVFGATEVHTVAAFARHASAAPPRVLLAAALAVRAPLHGHVCVDLAEARDTVVSALEAAADVVAVDTEGDTEGDAAGDTDASAEPPLGLGDAAPVPLDELDWPDTDGWLDAVADSPLVARVEPDHEGPVPRDADGHLVPLVVERGRLYLTRFWSLERYVAADLRHRAGGSGGATATLPDAAAEIERLFHATGAPVDPDQLAAATAGVERDLVVVSGGPGTGKTTTVARFLAGLVAADLAAAPAGEPPRLRIALAAPTGKAAARMTEALRSSVDAVAGDLDSEVVSHLAALEAVTLHRLLGRSDGAGFRHGPDRRLPHDVVIVDEVSMVSLSLMAHLLAAVRPDATVLLVGDPSQLASIEAGAVLGDIVTGATAASANGAAGVGASVRSLRTVHRQDEGSGILDLAIAIRAGHPDAVLDLLRSGRADLRWIEPETAEGAGLDELQRELAEAARGVVDAATDGDIAGALGQLAATKVLCAHRRGDLGVAGWNQRLERQLGVGGFGDDAWYVGRPVMVTRNDPLNGVFNGDVGVATRVEGRDVVWFPRAGGPQRVDSARLDRIATQWAMSIHKSQGSEFDHVVVTLPAAGSRILTRELLYTAVTRARTELTLVASEAAIRTAVERPVTRASGLATRLQT